MALTDEQKANLSEELIAKAMQCETPEQLIELAKNEDYYLTLDEAEAYLNEFEDFNLDSQQFKAVASGSCWGDCGGDDCNDCPCFDLCRVAIRMAN